MSPDDFLAGWHALVVEWAAADEDARPAVLDRALADGLPDAPHDAGTPSPDLELRCSVALVNRAKAFDPGRYRLVNAATKRAVRRPVRHFCEFGWRQLSNPRRDFDVWWYWNEHLDPLDQRINPLVHHLLVGRRLGLSTEPPVAPAVRTPDAPDGTPRRAVLMAAQDPDGLVDDTVLTLVTELARHGDVYLLADSTLAPDQLERVAGVTRRAWSIRHGGGSLGSWSLLARELVGWAELATYDEVLLVDDGAYLVRPLDDVFARMDARACDWWGLYATKPTWSRDIGETEALPLAEARERWRGHGEMDPADHLRTGPHFTAFRSAVVADPAFRRRIETPAGLAELRRPEAFEGALAHQLASAGYVLDAFDDRVRPEDTALGEGVWDAIAQGRPLLDHTLIAENPLRVPDLAQWPARLGAVAAQADVAAIERHVDRVAPDDARRRALAVTRRDDGTIDYDDPYSWDRFRREDAVTAKFDHWWAFPVCAYDHALGGNERAVFEQVRDDPSIKKIILTRSREVDLGGVNVVVVPLMSREGQELLLRSRQIFVKHGPQINAHWPLSPLLHHFVNTWHGIPLKRFGAAAVSISSSLERRLLRENGGSRAVITSSGLDTLAMTTAFWPLTYTEMWNTGLPRNDFITCDPDRLPSDLRATEQRLRDEVGDRRLVMFLPTFKDGQAAAYYHFTDADLERIADWMERHDAVLGVREHMADEARTYWHQLAPLGSIDLSSRRYPDLEVLYRVASGLVSDYSSCLVDFMLTRKPLASFAYDLDHYASSERGLFYDLDAVLPGPVCRTFDELADALDGFFEAPDEATAQDHEWRRRLFHDRLDDGAAARVVARVKELYGS